MSLWLTTHVITMVSVAPLVDVLGSGDYAATKTGALAFHKALTTELKLRYKAENVLTTIIHLNFVNTLMVGEYASALEVAGVRLMQPGGYCGWNCREAFL